MMIAVYISVLLLWLLTGWLSYTRAQHEAEELMDGHLAQTAHLLLAIVHDNEKHIENLAQRLASVRGSPGNVYEPALDFQVGLADGTLLARSPDAPRLPIRGAAGYSDILRGEESWRLLNLSSEDGRYRVQVSQAIGLRDRAALEVAGQVILPLALVLPALLLFIYVSIRRGLRPLDTLAQAVSARTPDNLGPLVDVTVPAEVRPLVAELNTLFDRVAQALESERRFTADAAHELRTPLAALKVQAQVAMLSSQAPMRQKALQQILGGVDRADRLVEQLLRLARLDPQQQLEHAQPVDLAPMIREVVALAATSHAAADGTVQLDLPAAGCTVRGDAELLGIAVRNLVDNALRYAGEHGAVRVVVEPTEGRFDLWVYDSGPGVPQTELAGLGQRFFRGRSHLEEGSGLGLAIVQRVAELHGAQLRLANRPEGGFKAGIVGLPS
ncbi:two-component sensor histidine kinase [Thioalkalivibrio sp. XN279]|nr:two-component sensor histidine kinase [Thioalkalivibrio sp. XN279]